MRSILQQDFLERDGRGLLASGDEILLVALSGAMSMSPKDAPKANKAAPIQSAVAMDVALDNFAATLRLMIEPIGDAVNAKLIADAMWSCRRNFAEMVFCTCAMATTADHEEDHAIDVALDFGPWVNRGLRIL